ncbi:hypothetical protein Clacol_004762 [Clathrus columnatus]|uniref:Uncharacterized protein n=1 Tax=Clathrus columnatus TaxID=1419009 RepID=A0AAV5AC90_9AGAM|nr:hypothetical protein Clacol_004762 [Clathrus columnatus]
MSKDFFALLPSIQARIDEAFDHALATQDTLSGLANESPLSHCFGKLNVKNDKMLHSVVPQALNFLNLPQDDESIFQALRDAAQAWDGGKAEDNERSINGCISRKVWRAVCAAVMGGLDGDIVQENDVEVDLHGGYLAEDVIHQASQNFIYDEDLTVPSNIPSATETDAQSDYEHPVISRSRRKKKHHIQGQPSLRQKQIALEAFALFFPSYSAADAAKLKLTVHDLESVAKSLKENLKSDERTRMKNATNTDRSQMMLIITKALLHVNPA